MKNKKKQFLKKMLEPIAERFRVLGEPNRLRLIMALEQGEKNVTDLVEETSLTQANVSRHLSLLTDKGILGRRKDGLNVYYYVSDKNIFELCKHVCGSLETRIKHQAKAIS